VSARPLSLAAEIENGELAGVDVLNRYAHALFGARPVLAVLGVERGLALVGRTVASPTGARRPDRAA